MPTVLKNITPVRPFSLNIHGRTVVFDRPAVMGIINVTADSFYAGSRAADRADIAARAAAMVADGADILDLGACSTRPGSTEVPAAVELERIAEALSAVREAVGPHVLVSVDTFRAEVARKAVGEWGADIINDISAGAIDHDMFDTVAELGCPYVLMHMRGTPATMQTMTDYDDVTADVIRELSHPLAELREAGVADIIIDPGFGFAKTLEQNYELLRNLDAFSVLGCPVLAGMSRKSMLTRLLGISADEACTATSVVNAFALERGAAVLRVHDVREAVQTVRMYNALITGE